MLGSGDVICRLGVRIRERLHIIALSYINADKHIKANPRADTHVHTHTNMHTNMH